MSIISLIPVPPFIKSKDTVPSAATLMFVIDLPISFIPSAFSFSRTEAGDEVSVSISFST